MYYKFEGECEADTVSRLNERRKIKAQTKASMAGFRGCCAQARLCQSHKAMENRHGHASHILTCTHFNSIILCT